MYSIHSVLSLCTSIVLLSLAGCGDDTVPGANDSASQEPSSEVQAAPEAAPADTGQAQERFDLSLMGFDDGDTEEAVVHVIEFSDFGCVHCANFHMDSYPALYEEFIAAGDVAWKYIPISLAGFPNSREAAIAGECAGQQGDFPAMRSRLFELRETWMESDDPEELFVAEAREAGLDVDAFQVCLNESEAARERVDEGTRVARAVGVTGTPTFVVQGHPVQGAPPLDAFQEVLRDLVAEARDPGH